MGVKKPTIRLERLALLRAARQLAPVLAKNRNTLPILSCIRLRSAKGTLRVTATNLDTWVTISLPVDSTAEFDLAIPAKPFQICLSTLPDVFITLELGTHFTLSSALGTFDIKPQKSDDYPVDPYLGRALIDVKLSPRAITHTLKGCGAFCSKEESRSLLMGFLLRFDQRGHLQYAGTDTHRLIFGHLETGLEGVAVPESAVVPAVVTPILSNAIRTHRAKECRFESFDKTARFSWPGFELVTRILDGKFPDHEKFLKPILTETPETVAVFRRSLLLGALRSGNAIFKGADSKRVGVQFLPDKIVLFFGSALLYDGLDFTGRYRLAVPECTTTYTKGFKKLNGERRLGNFNAYYLQSICAESDSEFLKWSLRGALDPSLLECCDQVGVVDVSQPRFIAMPMQLDVPKDW